LRLLTFFIPITFSGVAAGTVAGLFGVGGGIIMVPLLVLLFGYEQHIAQGTSLAVMLPLSVAGCWRYAAKGNVEWGVAVALGIGAVVGVTFLGAPFAHHLEGSVLRKLFGVLLIVIGLNMMGAFRFLGAWLGLGTTTP